MTKHVGIDLGTTNSAIAILDDFGKPEIIPTDGERVTPSVAAFPRDDAALIIVGKDAKEALNHEPSSVIQFVKREMGTEKTYSMRGETYTPQQISALIIKKLKVAGGADYDTGSNAAGYQTKAGSLRSSALASYREKEKEGNIAGVVYVTSALPNTTPVDLGGRPMVASASEAQKCVAVPSTPLHTLSCFLFAHLCTRPLTAL